MSEWPKKRRLMVVMDADDHRQLKEHAVMTNTTMRELVISLLRREGVIQRKDSDAAQAAAV